ncbi:dnaJ homolog subfamily C member 24-like [Uloborus diversus]|uniref:dnaJ homolog subfamily C member 24-like n=1 Tax=Uloborus diversus TaxID=327109 RepID=UPI002409A3F6|nr:dnaJ homolog subfamily C member 24-like [Uloborus diversus]
MHLGAQLKKENKSQRNQKTAEKSPFENRPNLLNGMSDYYTILGCSASSTYEELKQNYFKLIRLHHPDKNGNKELFCLLDEAWKVLGNAESRKMYDAELRAKEIRFSHAIDQELNLSDLTWNSESRLYEKLCRCGGKYILLETDVSPDIILIDCDNCSLSIEVDCDNSVNKISS